MVSMVCLACAAAMARAAVALGRCGCREER